MVCVSSFLLLIAANIGETVELETNTNRQAVTGTTLLFMTLLSETLLPPNWAAWVGRTAFNLWIQ